MTVSWQRCVALVVVCATQAFAQPAAAPAVQPPVLLQESPAHYPDALVEAATAGDVQLSLVISETGAVTEVTVVKGVAPAMDAEAVRAARALRFSPASVEGKPVAVQVSYTYQFRPPVREPDHATVSGQVLSRGTRKPVEAAEVLVNGVSLGQTDAEGHFSVQTPVGAVRLEIAAVGFERKTFTEQLAARQAETVLYRLTPLRANNYESIVRDERDRDQVSLVTLRHQEVSEVPGSWGGDPLRVVNDLPSSTPQTGTAPFPAIRGSSPGDTLYFFDGIRVPLLFHQGYGPGVLNPDFIDSLDVFAGGVPARFEGSLGGAVNANIARPHDSGFHWNAQFDLFFTGAYLEEDIPSTGTSLSAAARYTALGGVLGSLLSSEDDTETIGGYDYQARVEQRLGGGRLRLFAFGSDDTSTSVQTGDDEALHLNFHRVDLRYRHPLAGGELVFGGTLGIDLDDNHVTNTAGSNTAAASELSYDVYGSWSGALGAQLEASVGFEVDHRNGKVTTESNAVSETVFGNGTFTGVYGQLAWKPVRGLLLTAGLRAEDYHLVPGIDFWAIDPRISARLDAGRTLTLKAGISRGESPASTFFTLPAVAVTSLGYGLQDSIQYEAGLEWRPFSFLDVMANGYYKDLRRVVDLTPFGESARDPYNYVPPSAENNPVSRGHAEGVELMVRHHIGENWFGWVSYTYQQSFRDTTYNLFDAHGTVIGSRTETLPYGLDRRHSVSAVVGYKFQGGWAAGLSAHYISGALEVGGPVSYTHVEGTDVAGNPSWVPVDRNQAGRLPAYVRFDARGSKIWVFDAFTLEAFLDFFNIGFQPDVEGYSYNVTRDPTSQLVTALDKSTLFNGFFLPMLGVKARY